jgi:hypothetical protein
VFLEHRGRIRSAASVGPDTTPLKPAGQAGRVNR